MFSRASKLRFRRRFRMQRLQVEELSQQAEQQLERNFFRRLERLAGVRRFVLAWVLLTVLLAGVTVAQTRSLSSLYQVPVPVAGGTYREGVLGQFTNANPIYATGLADTSVSQLVFAGLLRYDRSNRLTGDLAESWQSDTLGEVYTVRLKPGLTWHDGEELDSADVVFTYNVIQNPDARSPLAQAWKDVKVTAPDARTVKFELPNPLASFTYSLTNGIIPEHILGDVPMADMRSASFNTTGPVGAGPFRWQALEVIGTDAKARQERIALRAFEGYNGGRPKLGSLVVNTFRSPEQLINSFADREINAIAGLQEMPGSLQDDSSVRTHNMLLAAEVMTFFRNEQQVLKDKNVRKALVQAVDTISIIKNLGYPTIAVREPLLSGQLGFDPKLRQLAYNPTAAKKLLDEQGWKPGGDGIRSKGGQRLAFALHTQNNSEYENVANQLSDYWLDVGAEVNVVLEDESALQNTLAYHSYDALLYGISIGPDPDVFVYWHSSQADARLASRLNFSEYNSKAADAALADARTRIDPELRNAKLQPFLEAWRADAPALGLYQPRFLYITRGEVHGLTGKEINSAAQRFSGVQNWMIREARETPEF